MSPVSLGVDVEDLIGGAVFDQSTVIQQNAPVADLADKGSSQNNCTNIGSR